MSKKFTLARWPLAGALSLLGLLSTPAQAGQWGPPELLQGPMAVTSLPEPPLVAMNRHGHALMAWANTGQVRLADQPAGAAWRPARNVPGAQSNGLLAATLGSNEVVAVAWATVATRYEASKLKLSLRLPGGGFSAPVEPVPGVLPGSLALGVACDGSITLMWTDATAVWASRLAGQPGAGPCNGRPGAGPWGAPVRLSSGLAGTASLAALATNDAGAALVAWQEGPPGDPGAILAALQDSSGRWQPAQQVSAGTGQATWNPKPALDQNGQAAVAYLDGQQMMLSLKPADGTWRAPENLSGSQTVYYPALAMGGQGELLAAWMSYDANNIGTVSARLRPAGGDWAPAQRLSTPAQDAAWPSVALDARGTLAVVGWTDNQSNTVHAAVSRGQRWQRSLLDNGYWNGQVPVAAGGGRAAAGWTRPAPGNPNSASLLGSTWE